jgi:hypothetical protein
MTSEAIDYNKVREQLNELHREDIYNTLAHDATLKSEVRFTTGQKILIHQFVGQRIPLSDKLVFLLYTRVKLTGAWQRPKYYYNEDRQLTTKD